ncbi:MAG: UDP-N-acetylmuramoyl-L-alanyl-D-glutamate--2,6-diaminopimelate ligase, partial [Proteobacteria bacterium]|nr:UDP-N-acetylmuramoyl-L-alanyl-D-glutamate--2,6-diaminopimelate ligase [Pseudomonadota bacterium]
NLFIEEALNNGACAVIVSKDYYDNAASSHNPLYQKSLNRIIKDNIPLIVVDDAVDAVSKASSFFYKYPSRELALIGITGTNGKTSTAFMIESALKAGGFTPGLIGTILYRYKDKEIREIEYTTPKSLYLQRMMRQMISEKITHVSMEVSSHGIELGRVTDLDFEVAVFTNLTRDHMDFHKDMDDYFNAKKKLFTDLLPKSTRKNKAAIINIDCEYGRKLTDFVRLLSGVKLYTYGFDPEADIHVDTYEFNDSGTVFTVKDGDNSYKFELTLIGKHNIYNALAAITVAMKNYGVDYKSVYNALAHEAVVPGRLERVLKGYNVFVDYAHTDDALMNVLTSLRNVFPQKRIVTVFGCGGDRDKGKRPKMGKIVSDLSDYSIVTSDNPRSEDPINIIESIVAGMRRNCFEVIPDRKMAIKKAIESMNREKDVILIAGKGHENYQLINGVKHDFDDKAIAKSFLQK